MRDSIRLSHLLLIISISISHFPESISAIKCASCEGERCRGKSCQGDYCVISRFVPRWGTVEYHKSMLVKGCMDGSLLREDIRDHCEVSEADEELFTCFCNGKDDCQAGSRWNKLKTEDVPLVKCECKGEHCDGDECIGELCTYVEYKGKDGKSVQKGCLNASIPILERRSVGACMVPPITGAMHHHMKSDPVDLLRTESCICGTDFCNRKKLKVTQVENSKCKMYAKYEVHGKLMESKEHECKGEYCFESSMNSSISQLQSFAMAGCASFAEEAELADEMEPVGCARFESEKLQVKGCFTVWVFFD
ncbi:unnamed protein product, partial [Mesorhabditis belari]|uniref:Uncharacterized protein n=1 Tax=Mesorhabditis belari TaxID=2138241 RepID=A0AAF3FF56_9BILA